MTFIDLKNNNWIGIYYEGNVEESRAVWDYDNSFYVKDQGTVTEANSENKKDVPAWIPIVICVLFVVIVGVCALVRYATNRNDGQDESCLCCCCDIEERRRRQNAAWQKR